MRRVQQHLAECLAAVGPQRPLEVVLADAAGCVLAQDVTASGDLPALDLADRDGYALHSADIAAAHPEAPATVPVLEEVRAGSPERFRLPGGQAVKISSGAPLPIGADTVVPLASTDRGGVRVRVHAASAAGENVRRQGEDVRAGETVLPAGQRIGARQMALLAALGRGRVTVHPRPRIVVISVGNELVDPSARARPGQIHDANGHGLATAIDDAGGVTYRVAAVPDEQSALRETIEDQLVRADLIITTGGLSDGGGDTVKDVLAPLGTVRFDNLAMAPGGAFGLGVVGEGTPIMALPGHPVIAQIAFEAFVRPAVLSMSGYPGLYRDTVTAAVSRGWYSPPGRREFVPVRLTGAPGRGYLATPEAEPGSLRLSALAASNALAIVPEDTTQVAAGDEFTCMIIEDDPQR